MSLPALCPRCSAPLFRTDDADRVETIAASVRGAVVCRACGAAVPVRD